ncbi:MAG TPA: phage holin family protein [Jatrophihabitans sp.]
MSEEAQSNDAGRHAADPTVGQLVSDASAHLTAIVQGELELAKLELKSSLLKGGIGAAAFILAGALFTFSLTFGLIAAAEGIHTTGLSRWLSYLIIFGATLLLTGIAILVGVKLVKRVEAPKRTIQTSKDTVAFLKSTVKRG